MSKWVWIVAPEIWNENKEYPVSTHKYKAKYYDRLPFFGPLFNLCWLVKSWTSLKPWMFAAAPDDLCPVSWDLHRSFWFVQHTPKMLDWTQIRGILRPINGSNWMIFLKLLFLWFLSGCVILLKQSIVTMEYRLCSKRSQKTKQYL